MFIVIVLVVIFIAFAITAVTTEKFNLHPITFVMLFFFLVSSFGFILFLVTSYTQNNYEYNLVVIDTQEIVTIPKERKGDVPMYLKSTTVDNHSVYKYMIEDDDGKVMSNIDSVRTVINETSDEVPSIVKYEYQYGNKVLDFIMRSQWNSADKVIINIPEDTMGHASAGE